MEPSTYLRCPTCGQMDMVQKVSTVVEGGTTHGTATSYGTAYGRGGLAVGSSQTSSTHQTVTSRKLAFPEHRFGCLIGSGIASIIFAPIAFFIAAVIVSGYVAVNHLPIAKMAQFDALLRITFWSFIVLGVLAIVYVIVKKISNSPKRQQALMIWHRLFYCYRDDTIFAPDDPTLRSSASNMRSILNY